MSDKESLKLTDAEKEVAARWFKGQATDEELREAIRSYMERLAVSLDE